MKLYRFKIKWKELCHRVVLIHIKIFPHNQVVLFIWIVKHFTYILFWYFKSTSILVWKIMITSNLPISSIRILWYFDADLICPKILCTSSSSIDIASMVVITCPNSWIWCRIKLHFMYFKQWNWLYCQDLCFWDTLCVCFTNFKHNRFIRECILIELFLGFNSIWWHLNKLLLCSICVLLPIYHWHKIVTNKAIRFILR